MFTLAPFGDYHLNENLVRGIYSYGADFDLNENLSGNVADSIASRYHFHFELAAECLVLVPLDDYDLNVNLLRGTYSYGFEKSSAIQQRGTKPILRPSGWCHVFHGRVRYRC